MEFSLWTAPRPATRDLVVEAERLGYEAAYLLDSPALYSDPFSIEALCADATSTIRLGHGVTNPATRLPMQMASSLGTLNALAPGRTFWGIGSGYTALAACGSPHSPMRVFADYIRTVKALIAGETAEFEYRGHVSRARFIHGEGTLGEDFVNFTDKIPVYIAAAGPKALALAGELADGLICVKNDPTEEYVRSLRAQMQVGADRVGRRAEDIPIMLLVSLYIMERGEKFGNDRMKDAIMISDQSTIGCFSTGHFPGLTLSNDNIRVRRIGDDDIPEKYRQLALAERRLRVERGGVEFPDEEEWYLTAYEGHGWRLRPELRPYVSEDVLRGVATIETAEEMLKKFREWERIGITSAGPVIGGTSELAAEMTEHFAKEIIARY